MGRVNQDREEAARLELERLQSKPRKTILALDPGTSATGIAVLEGDKILSLGVLQVKGSKAEHRLPEMCRQVYEAITSWEGMIDVTAVEWQAIRPGDKRPNDILHLAIVIGAALAAVSTDVLLTPVPSEWKGSVPESIFTKRVEAKFPEAAKLLEDVPAPLRHNALDALGLASWAQGSRTGSS